MDAEDEQRDADTRRRILALAARDAAAQTPAEPVLDPDPDEGMERNLAAIRKRIGAPQVIVPLRKNTVSRMRWYWGGIAAAAAVALYVLMPRQEQGDTSSMAVKGPGGAAAVVPCEIEPRSTSGSLAIPAAGAPYRADGSTVVQFAVKCADSVFIHVAAIHQADSAVIGSVRNFHIEPGKKSLIGGSGDQPFQVTLSTGEVTVQFIATKESVAAGRDVTRQDADVVWADEVSVAF